MCTLRLLLNFLHVMAVSLNLIGSMLNNVGAFVENVLFFTFIFHLCAILVPLPFLAAFGFLMVNMLFIALELV